MPGCRPLTDQEVSQVLEKLTNSRDRLLFILGIKTGFRISEMLSLKIGDVYVGGKAVPVIKVTRSLMKGGAGKQRRKVFSREVPLHSTVLQAIEEHVLLDLPNHYLFQSRQGDNKPISRVQAWNILKDAYAAVGLTGSVALHSMRKSFAGNVYEKLDHDIIATRDAMGHADVGTTQRYLSTNRSRISKAILED